MPENAFCDSGSSPPLALEPFVSADEAARFLSVTRRHLLTLARRVVLAHTPWARAPSAKLGCFDSPSLHTRLQVRIH